MIQAHPAAEANLSKSLRQFHFPESVPLGIGGTLFS